VLAAILRVNRISISIWRRCGFYYSKAKYQQNAKL